MRVVEARADAALTARVVRRTPLRYAGGADPSLDRPAYVRAGSGVARVGGRLAVIQDDANFLALVDPATGLADAVPLPAGEGGARQFDPARGTKHLKLDHEACVALVDDAGRDVLVAFGSGSTPRRERVLVATFAASRPHGPNEFRAPDVRLADAGALYAALRDTPAFAGSELNVEGAALVGRRVRLFGRGNGAVRGDVRPVNATCDLDAVALLAYLAGRAPTPRPRDVVQYALGALAGCPLGFTDATSLPDGAVVFTAAAEASPNAVDDGAVAGSAVGVISPDGRARWAPLTGADGEPLGDKAEGVTPASADGARLWVVFDADDPARPSELGEVVLDS